MLFKLMADSSTCPATSRRPRRAPVPRARTSPELKPPLLGELPDRGLAQALVLAFFHPSDEAVHAAIRPGMELLDDRESLPLRIEGQHEHADVGTILL